MATNDLEKIKKAIIKEYEKKTPKSKKHFEEAQKYSPGGGTRNIAYFPPYPFYITHGEGYYLYDVDGNEYLDVQNNMTVLLHGHAHPKMVEALQKQAEFGTCHAAPMEEQYQLGKILCDRVPSVEEVRFCNSGTEATMFAIRAARAFTGKKGLIKVEGGYHGSHDYVMINMDADLTAEKEPKAFVERGISETLLQDVYIVAFNDLKSIEKIMKKHHKKIGSIIIEPVMGYGGAAIASKEYLQGIRDLCDKYNIMLIFDEVITFRLAYGGFQEIVGVKPDLTAFGKTIGGGLPIGAFGGRKEIMEQFNPMHPGYIMHSGTFSGNAMSMIAGKTALELYDKKAVKKLDKLGQRLQKGLQKIFKELDVDCRVGGVQSIQFIQFPNEVPRNKQHVVFNTIPFLELSKYLQIAMSIHGLYVVSRGVTGFMLSTIMDEGVIDEILTRFRKAFEMVLPIYEDVKPFKGFSGIIYAMLKGLNQNKDFAKNQKTDDYSLFLASKDDDTAIKVVVKDGKLSFTPIENTKENIKAHKKECSGAIITKSKPSFFGIATGKLKPLKAILTGKLQLKGMKYVKKFTSYFSYLNF